MARLVFRRSSWYSDFRVGNRRIQRALSPDKREAQIKLGKLIESLRAERRGEADQNITWEHFKGRYLEYCAGSKKESTAHRDAMAISAFDKLCPVSSLRQLTPELLDRFKAKRLGEGKGKPTVARDVCSIKAMMHKAEAWGYVPKRNWASVSKIKVARKKLYFHSPEELSRMMARCTSHWRLVILLGARAGLRRGEIQTLTWEDVDFERNRLHVVAKELDRGVRWEPKDYEQRFIPLAPDLREALLAAKTKARSRWVVVEASGHHPSVAVMSAYMRKIARRVGLRGALHILRHTFGSHLAQAGVPLKTIKDLMGHSDMATTEIYAELLPENLAAGVALLPAIPKPKK